MDLKLDELAQHWAPLRAIAHRHRDTLLVWIADAAMARKLDLVGLARVLDLPTSYLRQLYAGVRQVQFISDDVAGAFGHFLGLPVIVVLCAAGALRLEDFYSDAELNMAAWAIPVTLDEPELLQVSDGIAAYAGYLAGLNGPHRRDWSELLLQELPNAWATGMSDD